MFKINQTQPWIDNKEANYIKKVVKKTFLTESNETKKFELKIKKFCKSKYSISISNWTVGLFACLKVLNIKKGDEVIVPNLTFIATVNSVLMAGATPVLCDVGKGNFNIDIKKVKRLINAKTKAIIPVHLYGHCCEMDVLKRICKKNKIFLVEDAAQALGATFKNKNLGNIGDMGGFSFYGNKIITTGEGGVILTSKKKYFDEIYQLKNHGRKKKGTFKHEKIGYNFMFTEMQAAIGNIQMNKLNKILRKKKFIFDFYKKNLSDIKNINFMNPIKYNKPVYWFSNIIVKNKNKLKNFLKENNIQTRDIFYPIHKQPCYKNTKLIKNMNNSFPVSEEIYKEGLSLPSGYELKSSELNHIIFMIKKFYGSKKNRN